MRADLYLFKNGYSKSREKARVLIESGCVKINSLTVKKPSFDIDESAEISIEIEDICPFVSRGGLKLDKILSEINLDVSGFMALDIGASTGGFTDCLLQRGAKLVYAVDSGHGQLDKRIESDGRVISIEGFNARNIGDGTVPKDIDIAVVDVSFISQSYILPEAVKLLKPNGIYIGLIKPQFEAGRENVSKGGIVKDKKARYASVMRVIECAKQNSFLPFAFIESPIKGGDGNTEYLCAFSRSGGKLDDKTVKNIVLG
ncbi:MAG: TlyA family RNA methyltransferase [Eubacteriales bacterium]